MKRKTYCQLFVLKTYINSHTIPTLILFCGNINVQHSCGLFLLGIYESFLVSVPQGSYQCSKYYKIVVCFSTSSQALWSKKNFVRQEMNGRYMFNVFITLWYWTVCGVLVMWQCKCVFEWHKNVKMCVYSNGIITLEAFLLQIAQCFHGKASYLPGNQYL